MSQEGILAKTYIPEYGGYYIGGESVGWSIDESIHTNGNVQTYQFALNFPEEYKDIVQRRMFGGVRYVSMRFLLTDKGQ